MSASYAPPNNAWETVEGIGKNPAPGLQFIVIDENVMKKLIPDEPKIRQNIFVATKRKRKGGQHYDNDEFGVLKLLFCNRKMLRKRNWMTIIRCQQLQVQSL